MQNFRISRSASTMVIWLSPLLISETIQQARVREYVSLLCTSTYGKKNMNIEVRCSFADVVRTAAEFFGVGGA
jgi:hypothetical protein